MFQSRFIWIRPNDTADPNNMVIELDGLELRNGFAGVGGLIQAQVIIQKAHKNLHAE
jgi:hypothetical protein